jgi:hypothetical protein
LGVALALAGGLGLVPAVILLGEKSGIAGLQSRTDNDEVSFCQNM